jgi:hypothetical protein
MAPRRPRAATRTTLGLFSIITLAGAARALGCTSSDGDADDGALSLPQRDPLDGEAGDGSTGTPETSVPNDAAFDAGPCSALAPFTTIAPLSSLSTPAEESVAHLRQDESLAFITRGASVAFYDRQSNGAWDGGAGVEINAGNADNVRLTDDLLSGYYNAYLGGGINSQRIHAVSRGTTSTPFTGSGGRLELGAQNLEADFEPFVLPDQQTLYFVTSRANDAGGNSQLWFAKRAGGSSWTPPQPVPGVSSVPGERRPVVSSDEKVIYFASERVANAKQNVFVGVRADKSAPFVVSEVTELSTASDEYPSWISPDLCRLYFVSDRAGGPGQRDVWLASRKP